MVVLSVEQYAELTGDIELKLDESDREAPLSDTRLRGEAQRQGA